LLELLAHGQTLFGGGESQVIIRRGHEPEPAFMKAAKNG
jgi:hypothetical protein